MEKFCMLVMVGLVFLGAVAVQAKGPAKIVLKAQPVENRAMWKGVVAKLGNNPMVRERVDELTIEPVAAENSTPRHPTFRANLWLKCAGAVQTKKLRANPSGMRIGVFERWILSAVQQRCR